MPVHLLVAALLLRALRAQPPPPPLLPPGVAFVAALDFDAAVGYRETHAAACTRAGLQPTQATLPLRSAARPNATWDAATVRAAIAALPAVRPEAPSLVSGCCAPALFCRQVGAPGAPAHACATHALGGYAYVNVGWGLDPSEVPVFTCALPPAAGAPAAGAALANLTASLPAVGAARLVSDGDNYLGQRLQLNGTGFGDDARALQVFVGGVGCGGVDVCHTQCRRCTRASQCGSDKICLQPGGVGHYYCVKLCDFSDTLGRYSCPCGQACYSTRIGGAGVRYCANKGTSVPTCASGPLTPPAGSGLTDRIECTPAWAARDAAAESGRAGNATPYPDNPGPRRLVRRRGGDEWEAHDDEEETGEEGWGEGDGAERRLAPGVAGAFPAGSAAAVIVDEDGAAAEGVDDAVVAVGAVGGAAGAVDRGGKPEGTPAGRWARRASLLRRALLLASAGLRQRRQRRQPRGRQLAAPGGQRLGGTTSQAGFRYDLTCPAGAAAARGAGGLYDVVVARGGWASSGLGTAAYAAAGVPLPANSSGSRAAPFQALPVVGAIPVVNVSSAATRFDGCASSSDCPWVDVCSIPRCVPQAPRAAVSCCVYEPTGRCASAPPLPGDGWGPQRHAFALLPREVAAALPMPPPPRGATGVLGLEAAAQPANMSVRRASVNPTALSWDPASTWYTSADVLPAAGSAAAVARPFAAPYNFSTRVSQSDDGPLAPEPLPFAVPFYGQQLTELFVGANGFLRVAAESPCFGSFSSARCDLLDGYAGVIAPLAADLEPCQYDDSEVYFGAWDASVLGEAALVSGVPSAQVACGVWLNMGLYTPAERNGKPPNPSFTFQACLHGDGGVRIRYGQVLGVPGYAVRDWGPGTVVPRYGGAPNVSSVPWLAGVRSMSATYHITDPVDFAALFAPASGANSSAAPGSEDVGLAIPTQTLLSRQGVKQSGTLALCALSPIACASPSCGGPGTLVALNWSPPGCGMGLDGLFASAQPSSGGLPPVPRIECVFGGVAVVASVTSIAPAASSDNRTTYQVTCAVPALPPAYVAAAAGGAAVVPLQLQLVLGASRRAYEPRNARFSLAGGLPPTGPSSSLNESSDTGIGPQAPHFDLAAGVAIMALEVYGIECMAGNGTCKGAAGGLPDDTVAFLVSKPLSFTYSADASLCGCSAGDVAATCDVCGVCGGDGAFVDCAGVCFGLAFVDDCGECAGGTTGLVPNAQMDCVGVCRGNDFDCQSPGNVGCSPDPSQSGSGLANNPASYILVSALAVCTLALTTVMFFVGWNSMHRHDREFDLTDLFGHAGELTLSDLGVSPGLSAATLATFPAVPYDPASTAKRGGDADDGEPDMCAVCMDAFASGDMVRVLPACKHCYHAACIDTWLARSTVCPTCRAELRSPQEVRQMRQAQRTILRQRAIMMGASPAAPTDDSSGGSGTDTDGGHRLAPAAARLRASSGAAAGADGDAARESQHNAPPAAQLRIRVISLTEAAEGAAPPGVSAQRASASMRNAFGLVQPRARPAAEARGGGGSSASSAGSDTGGDSSDGDGIASMRQQPAARAGAAGGGGAWPFRSHPPAGLPPRAPAGGGSLAMVLPGFARRPGASSRGWGRGDSHAASSDAGSASESDAPSDVGIELGVRAVFRQNPLNGAGHGVRR